MEEGLPTLPKKPVEPRPHYQPVSTAIVPFGPSTYVVQAPKDQIFRVPPPENAHLVEHYRNEFDNKRRAPACYAYLAKGLAGALLVLLFCLIVALVTYLVVWPRDPTFAVKGIVASSGGPGSKPRFDVTLTAKNPSARMGYFFDKGGKASLSNNQGESIAYGEPPVFDVGGGNSKDFKLLLRAKKARLPEKVGKRLKGSKDVIGLSLSVNFSVRPEVAGMKLRTKKVNAVCDVRVSNLAKGSRIVSQTCEAKFE